MKDIYTPKELAENASTILVPKGNDNRNYREAFAETTGMEIPAFTARRFREYAGGRAFYLVKAIDIPALVAMRQTRQGIVIPPGDRVGVIGTDVLAERPAPISSMRIGGEVCRFSLLAAAAAPQLDIGDGRRPSKPVPVTTSYPRLLGQVCAYRDLPFVPVGISPDTTAYPSGSCEIMPDLIGVDYVADLVASGATALDNDKAEVMRLASIAPELVWRQV